MHYNRQSRRSAQEEEEEERIAQNFAKYIQQQEEEKERSRAEHERMDRGTPGSQTISSFNSEEEIVNSGENIAQAADKFKRQLHNPKLFQLLAKRFEGDEDLKNIVMQRTDTDLATMQACDGLLNKFFDPVKFPDMQQPNLAQPKFTPTVELRSLLPSEEQEPAQGRKLTRDDPSAMKTAVGIATHEFENGQEGRTLVQDRIDAGSLAEIFSDQGKKLAVLLQQMEGGFDEVVRLFDGQEMDAEEKLAWLRTKALLFEQLMGQRKIELARLHPSQSQREPRKRESRSSIGNYESGRATAKKAEETAGSRFPSVRGQSGGRRYRVNFGLLQRRERMSQIEIMERRYHVISDRDRRVYRSRALSPRPLSTTTGFRLSAKPAVMSTNK